MSKNKDEPGMGYAVRRQLVIDAVKKNIKRTLQSMIVSGSVGVHAQIQQRLAGVLHHMQSSAQIENFKVDNVTVEDNRKSVTNEVDIPVDAVPGDPVYDDETGQYDGIIVSVSSPGHGHVLWNDPGRTGGGTIKARVTVQPPGPIEYVVMDFKVDA